MSNSISVEPPVRAVDVKSKIEAALKRSAEVDARRAAWAAPGVKPAAEHVLHDAIDVLNNR